MKNNFLKKIIEGTSKFSFIFFVMMMVPVDREAISALSPEKLIYQVRCLWFLSLGELVISAEPYLLDKQDIYQISASYQSPRWLSLFYNIHGKANSYIDTKTLFPMRYEEFYSYSWHDSINTVLIYDQEKKRVYMDRNGEKEIKNIFEDTLDPLSAFFVLRNEKWTVGEIKKFNLNNHQNNYQLKIMSYRKEKFDGQKTFHLKGTLKKSDEKKNFSDLEFQTWIADESSHLPLKVDLYTPYGGIILRLKR